MARNDIHCDGMTEEIRIGKYGFEPVPCNATRGLIAFEDWQRITRHACRWHLAGLKRKYGVMEPVLA